jgi:predicted NAD-dependent protein-ADP-ribosyltransferase YbiA (DUF1768 family)
VREEKKSRKTGFEHERNKNNFFFEKKISRRAHVRFFFDDTLFVALFCIGPALTLFLSDLLAMPLSVEWTRAGAPKRDNPDSQEGGDSSPEPQREKAVAANTLAGREVIKFSSRGSAPHYVLSNLYGAPIRVTAADIARGTASGELGAYTADWQRWVAAAGEKRFSGIEAAFQSMKATDDETRDRFAEGGDIALTVPFYERYYAFKRPGREAEVTKKAQKTVALWSKKNMAGIAPKQAVNKTGRAQLGLDAHLRPQDERWPTLDELAGTWHWLLRLKYTQNADARRVLLDTGSAYLLEFSIGALRKWYANAAEPEFYGGFVRRTADGAGELIGRNFMGNALMRVRGELASAACSTPSSRQ